MFGKTKLQIPKGFGDILNMDFFSKMEKFIIIDSRVANFEGKQELMVSKLQQYKIDNPNVTYTFILQGDEAEAPHRTLINVKVGALETILSDRFTPEMYYLANRIVIQFTRYEGNHSDYIFYDDNFLNKREPEVVRWQDPNEAYGMCFI